MDIPKTPQGASRFTASVDLPVPIDQAFAYHERPGCLNRLIPPWESVQIEHSDNSLQPGSKVILKTSLGGMPLRWHARHTLYEPPNLFADVQDSGPFAYWHHRHRFESLTNSPQESYGDNRLPDLSRLTDDVEYQSPGGVIGKKLGSHFVEQKLQSMFAYRHRITRDDLDLMASYPAEPLSIAVSGATGMVGSSLCDLLQLLGHRVITITRGASNKDAESSGDTIAAWSDDDTELKKFNDVDVVVHLAGKPIAAQRWTDSVKQEMRDSRVIKTRELCQRLAKLENPPHTLICASATGIFGNRGEEILNESSAHGDDFLASVAEQWEEACSPAKEAGIRVVNTRFGIVLSPNGGALQQMLLPAKLMGGKLGSGRHYWSWIGLDDALGSLVHAIHTKELSGPVNVVSPTPITNRDFAKTLGRVIGRPALFPAPKLALRLALGEMADSLLLASTRVIPDRLLSTGYQFRFTALDELLRYCLGKTKLPS